MCRDGTEGDPGLAWAATAGTESRGEGCPGGGISLGSAPLPASPRRCLPLPALSDLSELTANAGQAQDFLPPPFFYLCF